MKRIANKIKDHSQKHMEKAKELSSERMVVLILVIVLIWFLSAFALTQLKLISRSASETSSKLPSVEVESATVEEILSEITIYGQAEASKKVPLKARTDGYLTEKTIDQGNIVKKGDTLIKLSNDDRAIKLKSAESSLDQAKVVYESTRELYKSGLSSKNELKQSEANLNAAKSNYKSTTLDISYSNIKAPFNGFFDSLDVETGDFIKNGDIIGTIVKLDNVKVSIALPEKYINQVKKGSEARIELLSGYQTKGNVSYISSVADEKTRTFKVEILIKNKDGKINDGMTAKVYFPLSKEVATKISKLSAITFNDKGVVGLKTVNENNTVEFHQIKLLKQNKEAIWVSGLPKDSKVIINGQEYVKEGTKVKAVNNKE